MIILPPPRISNAGGFLDSDAIDVEHMQQRRFAAIHIGAYLTQGFFVQMERYLERGVVTPEADAALRRIVISARVRKMEGHQCSLTYRAAELPQVMYPSVWWATPHRRGIKVWLSDRNEQTHILRRGDGRSVRMAHPAGR